eukprot:3246576-Amphidinium_carterae.1
MTDSDPVLVAPAWVEEINSDDDGVTKLWLDVVPEPSLPSEEVAIPPLGKEHEDGSAAMDVVKENIELSEEVVKEQAHGAV